MPESKRTCDRWLDRWRRRASLADFARARVNYEICFQTDQHSVSTQKSWLLPQHLKAVEAATTIGIANVEDARLGSDTLIFEPAGIFPALRLGYWHRRINFTRTSDHLAGLEFCRVNLGSYRARWNPCTVESVLSFFGFTLAAVYPPHRLRGGGQVWAIVKPPSALSPLCVKNCGSLKRIRGISAVANL